MELREKMLKFPLLLYILFLALFARSCFARWSQESADIGRFSKGRRPSPSEYLGKRALQKDSRYIVRKLYEVAPYGEFEQHQDHGLRYISLGAGFLLTSFPLPSLSTFNLIFGRSGVPWLLLADYSLSSIFVLKSSYAYSLPTRLS